jgi:hypothetical protein
MSSNENTADAAQATGTSLLTQLVLEVYLAAWTRSALEDEPRLLPVASFDERDRGDADGVPDLDHFACTPGRIHISVRPITAFRYVEPVGDLMTRSGRARRFDRRRECLHRHSRAFASVARDGLESTSFWNAG